MSVANTVTISSTKIIGFLMRLRGSSLANAEAMADQTILGSSSVDIAQKLAAKTGQHVLACWNFRQHQVDLAVEPLGVARMGNPALT